MEKDTCCQLVKIKKQNENFGGKVGRILAPFLLLLFFKFHFYVSSKRFPFLLDRCIDVGMSLLIFIYSVFTLTSGRLGLDGHHFCKTTKR